MLGVSNATIGATATTTLTIADNDSAGFMLSRSSATVSESGSTEQFTLTLNSEPLSDVVFNIVSSDTGEAAVAPTSVSLDSTNWDTGAVVTITGVDDNDSDGDQTSTLTVSVDADSSDDAFDGLSAQTITVTTTEADDSISPTVLALTPSLASITDSDVGTGAFTLTVDFSEVMNTAIDPTITFPDEDPTSTLSFASGSWSDSDTYIATYDVTDADEAISDIDIRIEDTEDEIGNTQTGFY